MNKNDFCDLLDDLLTTHQANTQFQYDSHKFMEQVYTDLDSVWSDVNKMVDGIRKKHGVKFIFACPTNKNKMAMGEKMIQDDEKATKALMVQFRLPIQYWDFAMASALEARRLFPIRRNVKASDGSGSTL